MTDQQIHLTDTDQSILDEIEAHGRATPALLADLTGRNTQHVRDRIKRLCEHGQLVKVSRGLYDTPEHADEYLG